MGFSKIQETPAVELSRTVSFVALEIFDFRLLVLGVFEIDGVSGESRSLDILSENVSGFLSKSGLSHSSIPSAAALAA